MINPTISQTLADFYRLGLRETVEIIKLQILDKLDTRFLLKLKNEAHACGGIVDYPTYGSGLEFHVDEIKKILKTRGHIMNKHEAKEARRKRANQRRGQGKSRNR